MSEPLKRYHTKEQQLAAMTAERDEWQTKARWKHTHDDSLECELAKQLAAMTAERDSMRDFHNHAIGALYDQLGIDKSDGEIRFKWASLGVNDLKHQLAAAKARINELEIALTYKDII